MNESQNETLSKPCKDLKIYPKKKVHSDKTAVKHNPQNYMYASPE